MPKLKRLALFTLAFAAVLAVYFVAAHLALVTLGASWMGEGAVQIWLFFLPAALGLALMWPFGLWRADATWGERIAAVVLGAIVTIGAAGLYLMSIIDI